MVNFFKIILTLLILVNCSITFAQSLLFPSNFFHDTYNQSQYASDTSRKFPLHASFTPNAFYSFEKEDSVRISKPAYLMVVRNLFYEDLLHLDYMDKQDEKPRRFRFAVSPILSYYRGFSLEKSDSNAISVNTRGLRIRGSLGNRFRLESAFFENQSFFPDYFTKQYRALGIVPGEGRWKQFNNLGFDYAMACAVASYDVSKNINVQLGHGKNKSGYGYRSLLLSDNAFNYPYLKLSTRFWKGKIQYTNVYAILTNLSSGGTVTPKGTERLYQKKPAAFHELSIVPTRFLQLSFFQGLIWKSSDDKNKLVMDPQYFNPVIFSNLAFYGFDSTKNIYSGASLCFKLIRKINVYGQILMDDPSKNKLAWQGGIRYQQNFKNTSALMFFVEYNHASPFTYTASKKEQNITQYNQALAHPLGAAFDEYIGGFSFHYQRLSISARAQNAKQNISWGNQVLYSDVVDPNITYNKTAFNRIKSIDARVEACVNYTWKLYLSCGYYYRQAEAGNYVNPGGTYTQFVYAGLRTNLNNFYSDY